MRLHTLTLRNYRVHREQSIEFDEKRTLIGGPNESGKSTLAEALQRVFFLKAKGGTEFHRAMKSLHGGEPEVEVTFSLNESEYQLTKRFGSKGTTTLVPSGHAAWTGDAAESELARLLGLAEPVTGKMVAAQWAHIWVRQGLSGIDPSGEATQQQTSLIQRLQEMGGAAALQSDFDTALAARFRDEAERLFRNDGKAKAGSDMDGAQSAEADASRRRNEADARLQKSLDAIRNHEEASAQLGVAQESLGRVSVQKTEADQRAAQVAALRQKETGESRMLQEASVRFGEFEQIHQRIAGIEADFNKRQKALEPLARESGRLKAEAGGARQGALDAARQHREALEKLKSARQIRDLFVSGIAFSEKAAAEKELLERKTRAGDLLAESDRLKEELVRLPLVNEKQLSKLRALELACSTSAAALNAMAADLEVIDSDQEVRAGSEIIKTGDRIPLSVDTEILVGKSVRLLIRPGGGSNLDEARAKCQAAREALDQALESLGIKSLSEAAEIGAKRRELEGAIQSLGRSLKQTDDLPGAVREAGEARLAAEAELSRRREAMPSIDLPSSLDVLRKQLQEAEKMLIEIEQSETAAKAVHDQEIASAEKAEKLFARHIESIDKEGQEVRGLEIEFRLSEKTYGNGEARSGKIADLKRQQDAAAEVLAATREELRKLDADRVGSDVERLQRAMEELNQGIADYKTRMAVAEASLHSDGSQDPRADLAFETARWEAAKVRLDSVRRKAEAIRLLDTLFAEEQRALAHRFTQPLAETISGYLECCYGPGAKANVVFNDNRFEGLELVRPLNGGGAFAFETLSGGAREQVAAAMRLAMAEILASGFGGCLPVIFDDAFAYSDPERVQTLQRMLELAASRGIQVIALTCNPSDYAALGARQILLPAPSKFGTAV